MDSRGIGGWNHVAHLADYLVALQGLSLSSLQVDAIVKLYDNLDDFDKQRTTFSPRCRNKQTQGRFKTSRKRCNVTPGVESTKRYPPQKKRNKPYFIERVESFK